MSGPEKEREIKMLSELKKIEAANGILALIAAFANAEKLEILKFAEHKIEMDIKCRNV